MWIDGAAQLSFDVNFNAKEATHSRRAVTEWTVGAQ